MQAIRLGGRRGVREVSEQDIERDMQRPGPVTPCGPTAVLLGRSQKPHGREGDVAWTGLDSRGPAFDCPDLITFYRSSLRI